jgi:hypothetical protein
MVEAGKWDRTGGPATFIGAGLSTRNKGNKPPPVQPAAPTPTANPWPVVVLLLAGALVWALLGFGSAVGLVQWLVILTAGGIGLLPAVSRGINRLLDRLRKPSPQSIRWATLLIAAGAAGYFILTAVLQGRDLFPKTHDECSYYLGVQLLARGKLCLPSHPLADFFDSFYILVKPVYCSIYFPGTALLFIPTIWLHLPTWFMPAVASGAAIGLTYRVMTELIDGVAGALAALLMVSLTWLRTLSIVLMSQMPMLLLGLLLVWAWLKWRRKRSWGWALLMGVVAGWAAITRPVDAIVYAAPVGVAVLLSLRDQRPGTRLGTLGAMVAGAAPFLALQIAFDLRVTGHVFETPYTLYLNREQPGAAFGFHQFDPNAHPQSALAQQRADYAFSQTYFARHQPDNFWWPWLKTQYPTGYQPRPAYFAMIADTTLPARLLLVLVPAGLLGLRGPKRLVVFATLPLFILLYIFNPFFLEHYAIPIIPAVIVLVLLGAEAIVSAWPRYPLLLRSSLALLIAATAVTSLWEINRLIDSNSHTDESLDSPLLRKVHDLYGERAVILFRWDPKQNWKAEPVYNGEVTWPDDAEVIRAHDLGPRDAELIDYYAKIQPERVLFVWDQKRDELRRIGVMADLARQLRQGRSIDSLLQSPGGL